ncbi:unnamed protein product, partial [Mesorhabditis belari]|uniref:Glycosyltransferase family 92 protein n=1 Tax=Mesorhabditis belari TaxID=2138241 RepID=A0AAF3EKR2_9BILA
MRDNYKTAVILAALSKEFKWEEVPDRLMLREKQKMSKINRIFYFLAFLAIVFIILKVQKVESNEETSMMEWMSRLSNVDQAESTLAKDNEIKSLERFERLKMKDFELIDRNLTGEEMFVYYAYYDIRDPLGPRIRFLANAVCRDLDKKEITVDVGDGQEVLPLEWANGISTGGCADCLLQGMDFATVVHEGPVSDEIVISRKTKSRKVKLHQIAQNYEEKDEMKSCILSPLFWYNDWPRLFVFFEWWKRKNGIKKILIHIHSLSKVTKQLIDYYVNEGLVEVGTFPWMPFTADYNPNDHIFYNSVHIATQICSVWSDSKYTTMNDVDELFYVRNSSENLLSLTQRLMGSRATEISLKTVGALGLQATALTFPSGGLSADEWNYKEFKTLNFLKSTTVYRSEQYTKYIYETASAKKPWLHEMLEFFGEKEQIRLNEDQAVYLHMRNNYNAETFRTSKQVLLDANLRLFEDDELEAMRNTLDKIFPIPPSYKTEITLPVLSECRLRSKNDTKREKCLKTTGTTCYDAMKDLDDWVFAVPNEDSVFTPI